MSKYALLDLGSGFLPRAINVKGHVCGGQWSIPTLATVSATVYSEGVKTDLGALLGATASMAADINASGDVAGEWYDEIGSHAFLYAGGEAHKLPDKVGAAPLEHNMTVAINDVGDVVGYGAHVDTHDPVPWLRKPSGEVVNLRKVKGHLVDWIYDINNNGDILGSFQDDKPLFIHRLGTEELTLIQPPSGYSFYDCSMDDDRNLAGTLGAPPGHYDGVFRYSNGALTTPTPLGTQPSSTDCGGGWGARVVGEAFGEQGDDPYAFVWDGDGLTNLNFLIPLNPLWLQHASGMNHGGAITGWARELDGSTDAEPDYHGFILTPLLVPPRHYPPHRTTPGAAAAAVNILWGIINDAPGRFRTPNGGGGHVGPGPGDPGPDPGWLWEGLSRAQREVLAGFSINALAELIPNASARRAIQDLSANLVRNAAAGLSPGDLRRVEPGVAAPSSTAAQTNFRRLTNRGRIEALLARARRGPSER